MDYKQDTTTKYYLEATVGFNDNNGKDIKGIFGYYYHYKINTIDQLEELKTDIANDLESIGTKNSRDFVIYNIITVKNINRRFWDKLEDFFTIFGKI